MMIMVTTIILTIALADNSSYILSHSAEQQILLNDEEFGMRHKSIDN